MAKNPTTKKHIAVICSAFNDFITKRLLSACLDELKKKGIGPASTKVVWVPGSFEIPVTAFQYARRKDIAAVIALGAVIRGETYHFELVAGAVADGVLAVSLKARKPVIFGVLTTDTVRQAYKRSQPKGDNKGRDAAQAAVRMIQVLAS